MPVLAPDATSERRERIIHEWLTAALWVTGWFVVGVVHALGYLIGTRLGVIDAPPGARGLRLWWGRYAHELLAHPVVAVLVLVGVVATYVCLRGIRHRGPITVVLPPYDPFPDVRHTDDFVLGWGLTRRGKGPGDRFDGTDDHDAAQEQDYAVLPAVGALGNVQVTGAAGYGKSTAAAMNLADQAMGKWPLPPHPDTCGPVGRDGRYPRPVATWGERAWQRLQRAACEWNVPLGRFPDHPDPPGPWHPYAGLTRAEALVEYARLLEEHRTRKWAVFIVDYKGTDTEDYVAIARRHGRLDDVRVLTPGGPWTHNLLAAFDKPLSMAEALATTGEVVARQQRQEYYGKRAKEWLTAAMTVLKVAEPAEFGIAGLIKMTQDTAYIEALLLSARAEGRAMRDRRAERVARGGDVFAEEGALSVEDVDNAIATFAAYHREKPEDVEKMLSGVRAQLYLFRDGGIARLFSPPLAATFEGFEAMFRDGLIVILCVPSGTWGSDVAIASGVHLLLEAQDAAKRRREHFRQGEQARYAMFLIDEVARYVNAETNLWLSENRQSRVMFVGVHQNHGQVGGADDPLGSAFIAQTQTKVAFKAANGEVAKRESELFGTRRVLVSSRMASTTQANIQRLPDRAHVLLRGPESQSGSVRITDEERPWFDAGDFQALRAFEAIVMINTGSETLPPRKVRIRPMFETLAPPSSTADDTPGGSDDARSEPPDAEGEAGAAAEIPSVTSVAPGIRSGTQSRAEVRTHPVVVLRETTAANRATVESLLRQALLVIVDVLRDAAGDVQATKLVTSHGSVIVSPAFTDILSLVLDGDAKRVPRGRRVVLAGAARGIAFYRAAEPAAELPPAATKVLCLTVAEGIVRGLVEANTKRATVSAARRLLQERDTADTVREVAGYQAPAVSPTACLALPPLPPRGAWEPLRERIAADDRALLRTVQQILRGLHGMGEAVMKRATKLSALVLGNADFAPPTGGPLGATSGRADAAEEDGGDGIGEELHAEGSGGANAASGSGAVASAARPATAPEPVGADRRDGNGGVLAERPATTATSTLGPPVAIGDGAAAGYLPSGPSQTEEDDAQGDGEEDEVKDEQEAREVPVAGHHGTSPFDLAAHTGTVDQG